LTTGTLVHDALLYRDDGEYVDRIGEFFTAGLEAGEVALAAVPRRNLERLQATDWARDVAFADMETVGRNPSRIIPFIARFLARHSDRRVRFVGEPIWSSRSRAEIVEGVRHEALLNLAFAQADVTILCPYDESGLDADVIAEAGRTHPTIRCRGHVHPSTNYADPLEVYAAAGHPLRPPPMGPVAIRLLPSDLAVLRSWLRANLPAESLGHKRTSDFVLAVAEAATNTIVHAPGEGTVSVWQADREVVCEVSDSGTIADPLVGRREPDPDAVGGRGLWLINQLCDLVELRPSAGGTAIRLHMRFASA
jgi:anti-sigma regulatory factor (Ser/Thr protein kinase)